MAEAPKKPTTSKPASPSGSKYDPGKQDTQDRHPLKGGLEAGLLIEALKLAEGILPGVGMAGSQQWPDLPETVDFRRESQAFELRLRFDTKSRVCSIYTAPAPPAREPEEAHDAN